MTGSIEGEPRRIPVDDVTSRTATRAWWDAEADTYQHEHEGFLGATRWVWGPEGWDEADLGLISAPPGSRVLEVGCGAAAGSRWLRSQGVQAVGMDLSHRMLQHSLRLDRQTRTSVPVVEANASELPFGSGVFDVVATAYGALPFLADAGHALSEVSRVLIPGGRAVLAVTHPIRWAFPDDPGPEGLTAIRSYFDRTPYSEIDASGRVTYVEHHRTVGDWVDLVVAADLRLDRLVEPPWNPANASVWGGWSPLRGALLPGTMIIVAHKPADSPGM